VQEQLMRQGPVITSLAMLAGFTNTSGSGNNFIGLLAGAYNNSGPHNNFFGVCAGRRSNTGCRNNFIGYRAVGDGCVTGCDNNVMGFCAANSMTSGNNNNIFGPAAASQITSGANNVVIGAFTATSLSTGSNNIAIGLCSGTTGGSPSGLFNITTASNRIVMGNASHSCAQIQIGWTTVSDVRDKCIYGAVERGLGFLKGITPIKYAFKDRESGDIIDPDGKLRYGFSAQEILELEGEEKVIVSDEDSDKLQLTSDHIIPVLVNAVKELSAEIDNLKERVALLENPA
jgi:hypothetical protein